MVNCGTLQAQGEGEWGWGELKWLCWHCPLLPGWAGEGQGCDPHHPQRLQRAGMDSDWSELYFCQWTSSHKRIKPHFQRVCGHKHSHNGNVHMDCIPSIALVTGNPRSGLLFTNVTQAKSAQGALWCLGWVNAASWFHCALLPCKKGRMLFHMEHFTVEQNPAWGEPCNLNVLWPLCCVYPKL